MKSISLFDMDGTLCVSRKTANSDMLEAIFSLSKFSDIGIVSGSPMNYISEQLSDILDLFAETDQLVVMPCNGTQVYQPVDGNWQETFSLDMKSFLGSEKYRQIISVCTKSLMSYLNVPEAPITGNFMSYRRSLLNFCPVGRDAAHKDRADFEEKDEELLIRKKLLAEIKQGLSSHGIDNVDCTLGGYTSIDIYPSGWDKTYCLNHLSDYSTITFVGDKCEKPGNDSTIYDALSPHAFMTKSPEQTLDIITHNLISIHQNASG